MSHCLQELFDGRGMGMCVLMEEIENKFQFTDKIWCAYNYFCVVCKFWWKEFVLELFQDFKVAGCYSWSLGQTVMQIVLKSVLCI